MFYPIHPSDVRQEYELRVAAALRKRPPPQEYAVPLDFADFDRQRYTDTVATHRRAKSSSVSPRRLWDRIRAWGTSRTIRRTA